MNTTDKKNDVIQTLQSTSDEQLINEVYELLHPDLAIETIDITNIPSDLQKKLNNAMDDYKSGRYISHNEMKQKVAQWLVK